MIKSTDDIEKEIIQRFSIVPEWDEKYDLIIEYGKNLKPLDLHDKSEKNRIKGCQSDLWLTANYVDGKVIFGADSDSLIVRGLVSLLMRVLSGQSPDSILRAKLHFIDAIGMHQHLAPTRSNGLRYIINRMKSDAIQFRSVKKDKIGGLKRGF